MNNSLTDTNIPQSVRLEILEQIYETIDNYLEQYICDIHDFMFNQDYYIIGYYRAEQWLKEHNISAFYAIEQCRDFQIELFGESQLNNVDINAESIVNLLVYFYADNIINTIFYDLDIDTNEELTEENVNDIKAYIEEQLS